MSVEHTLPVSSPDTQSPADPSTNASATGESRAAGEADDGGTATMAESINAAPADSIDSVVGSYQPAGDVAAVGQNAESGETSRLAEVAGAADDAEAGPDVSDAEGAILLVREGDVAADYLETLLDIVDYDGDIDLDVENGRAIVAVVGSDLNALVGPNGATLDALQELTRLAVQQQTGMRSRLMLDVSGHRNRRRQQLTDLATSTAEAVLDSREPVRLSPMNPFERKVVHDAISTVNGVQSESEGDEPQRRVVVHPVG